MGANENTAADPAAQRTPLHKTTALCPDCLDEPLLWLASF